MHPINRTVLPAVLEYFLPLFSVLASESGPARLHVSVFYTRAASRSLEGLLLPPGITLTPGRPKVEELLNGFVVSIMNKGGAHGAFVGICGPVALAKDVVCTVRTFDAASKKAIGGIQIHEECVFAYISANNVTNH